LSRYSTLVCTVLSLVAVLTLAGPVLAQSATTTATFSGPVQLRGQLLSAGSYDFAIERDGRGVVVSDADHRVVATLRGIPITRSKRGDIITMRPSVAGAAPEVLALFPNGGTAGIEFINRAAQK
jgi:hypothetical protein